MRRRASAPDGSAAGCGVHGMMLPRFRPAAALVIALLALWLAGCAMAPHPWAPAPGPARTVAAGQPPVIFIHGAFGSRLADARRGHEIWPGGFFKLLFDRYAELAVDIDPASLEPGPERLVVSGLFERTGARDYYRAILRSLQRAGYREGRPGIPVGDDVPRYYVLLYDWRYDNTRAVLALDGLIAQIRRDHARVDLRVDLIGHSNGGLVARQYARFGTAGVDAGTAPGQRAGADVLRRVVLIGTPNLGTLESLVALTRGEEIGLRRVLPEVIATFPGSYALLPSPGSDWLVDADGRSLARDAHDPALWRELGLGLFDPAIARRVIAQHGGGASGAAHLELLQRYFELQLVRAGTLARALADPAGDDGIEPVVFGGDCLPTPARAVVETAGTHRILRLAPAELRRPSAAAAAAMQAPGDGTVTRASALGRRAAAGGDSGLPAGGLRPYYALFLCTPHNQLTADPYFHDNLLDALIVP